ncbi:M14 family metallocarboxypeptidase [Candidatus Poribacteria bacterium]|nr:M14 family metallocarboxypeptidase [Candidatus Poribacteria bacterium]
MNKITDKVRSYAEVVYRLKNLREHLNNLVITKLGEVHCSTETYDMFCIQVGTSTKPYVKRICLAAGIHGDEPAGVEAMLTFLENFHEYAALLEGIEVIILPCDNPFGYERNIRSNADGLDLNQQFQDSNRTPEILMIKKAIGQRSFDMSLDFHEDVESEGFYLWERKFPTPLFPPVDGGMKGGSIGDAVIQKMAQEYPIERKSQIEGFPNRQGVIFLDKRPLEKGWTLEHYLFQNGTKYCLTLETPVNMPLQKRVEMHLFALKTSLQLLRFQK